jgi:hypothetical protein
LKYRTVINFNVLQAESVKKLIFIGKITYMNFNQQLLIICLLLCHIGCSNDGLNRASVKGTVTLDGKPLEKGTIGWYPLNSEGPTVGGDITNGKYKLTKKSGPAVGEYRIEISGSQVPTGKKVPSGMDPSFMVDELVDPVPEKYHSGNALNNSRAKEPPLKATVSSGNNVIDFDLVSK